MDAPIGDAEAVVEGLFGLIYLYPSDYLIVFGSLTLFAVYGLSIYAGINIYKRSLVNGHNTGSV